MTARYRTRCVEVDAVRRTATNDPEMIDLAGSGFEHYDDETAILSGKHSNWVALEVGNWVVRDAAGALSKVDDDDFRAAYEPVDPAGPHRVTVTMRGLLPAYQVEHPGSCHLQRYEELCPFDALRLRINTATWPAEPGVYEATIGSASSGDGDLDQWFVFAPASAVVAQ